MGRGNYEETEAERSNSGVKTVSEAVSPAEAVTLLNSDAPTLPVTLPASDNIAITTRDAERLHRGASFDPGDVVANRFTIRKLLGKGGMGAVYEALDKEMKTVVALKTILPELDRSGQALERFKREIQVARLVTSRNVCRTFDIGYHSLAGGGDVIFVTMEYLPGETLSDWLRSRPPLTLPETLPLIQQMASGLEATHEKGIIHRDFKSANVMLVEERGGLRAVITDFGLARLNDPGTDSAGMTRGPMGSPNYMAPEQVEGKKPTPATDVYALGVVIYEMLTSHWPYTGDNVQHLMFRRISEPPTPPRVHNPAIHPRVEAVILKCLEREQEKRYQTPGEVVSALVSALETKQTDPVAPIATPPPAVATPRPIRPLVAAAGAVVAVGIAVAAWLAQHQQPTVKEATAVSTPVEAVQKPLDRAPSSRGLPSPVPSSAKESGGQASTTEVAVGADRTTPVRADASRPTLPGHLEKNRIVPGLIPAAVFAPVRAALARGNGEGDFSFAVTNGSTVKDGQQINYNAFARTPGVAYLLVFDGDHRVTCLFDADSSPGPVKLPAVRARAPFGKSLHALILTADPVELTAGTTYSWQEVLQKLKGASFRSHEELIDVLP